MLHLIDNLLRFSILPIQYIYCKFCRSFFSPCILARIPTPQFQVSTPAVTSLDGARMPICSHLADFLASMKNLVFSSPNNSHPSFIFITWQVLYLNLNDFQRELSEDNLEENSGSLSLSQPCGCVSFNLPTEHRVTYVDSTHFIRQIQSLPARSQTVLICIGNQMNDFSCILNK